MQPSVSARMLRRLAAQQGGRARACARASAPLASPDTSRRAVAPAAAAAWRAPARILHNGGIETQRRHFAQSSEDPKSQEKAAAGAEADAKPADEAAKAEAEKAEVGKEGEAKAETAQAAGSPPMEDKAPAEESEEQKESPKALLEKELAEAQEKLKKEKHQLLLSLADFENSKKKHQTEREGRRRAATANFAMKMIEVYDQFDELAHAEDKVADLSDSCKALQEGINMTRDIFTSSLDKFDIEPFSAEPGAAAVPARFERVGEVEGADVAADSIAEVVRRGWVLEPNRPTARVLRKAQVKVARQGPATPPPPK